MNIRKAISIYLVPGAVCQSVVVGGGYGTGREVVEFVSDNGPWGGLAALLTYAVLTSAVIALSFEFARQFRSYEYRGFFKRLIGRGWILYELLVIAGLTLILAVTGSAAAAILHDSFGVAKPIGVGLVFVGVVVLNYYGRRVVEGTLTLWAVLLTLTLAFYAFHILSHQWPAIAAAFAQDEIGSGWFKSGAQFGLNNSSLLPLLLYCATEIETRRQALLSGLIAGLSITLPGLAFHLTFMAAYPDIISEQLPTYWMIKSASVPYFLPIYIIVLFGTIAQTGVGVLQGVNERLDAWHMEMRGRPLPRLTHAAAAGAMLLASMALANFGVVALIAQGYGNLAWIALALFQGPLLTYGLYLVLRRRSRVNAAAVEPVQ